MSKDRTKKPTIRYIVETKKVVSPKAIGVEFRGIPVVEIPDAYEKELGEVLKELDIDPDGEPTEAQIKRVAGRMAARAFERSGVMPRTEERRDQ